MTSHFLLLWSRPVHQFILTCSTIKDKSQKSSRPSVNGASLSKRHRHSWCNWRRLGKDFKPGNTKKNGGNEKTRNPSHIQRSIRNFGCSPQGAPSSFTIIHARSLWKRKIPGLRKHNHPIGSCIYPLFISTKQWHNWIFACNLLVGDQFPFIFCVFVLLSDIEAMKTPTRQTPSKEGLWYLLKHDFLWTLWEVIAIDTENATVEVAWSASVEFRTLDELAVFFLLHLYMSMLLQNDRIATWWNHLTNELAMMFDVRERCVWLLDFLERFGRLW